MNHMQPETRLNQWSHAVNSLSSRLVFLCSRLQTRNSKTTPETRASCKNKRKRHPNVGVPALPRASSVVRAVTCVSAARHCASARIYSCHVYELASPDWEHHMPLLLHLPWLRDCRCHSWSINNAPPCPCPCPCEAVSSRLYGICSPAPRIST